MELMEVNGLIENLIKIKTRDCKMHSRGLKYAYHLPSGILYCKFETFLLIKGHILMFLCF